MRKRRVLVLDGGCVTALNFQKRLEFLGYECIPLANCSDRALAAAAEHRPDLMLFDPLHYGEEEGLAIAELVRGKLNIPVLLITGLKGKTQPSQTAETQKERKQKETSSLRPFLLRPLDDLELGAAIERAVYKHEIEEHKHCVAEDITVLGRTPERAKVPVRTRKDEDAAFEFMKQVSPFSGLPEKALTELVNRSYFSSARPGEYITFEGERKDASFIVFSGRLAMTKTSVSGKDLIVQLLGPRDFFGFLLAMEELPEQLSARAQSESEVLWIPTAALLRVLDNYPDLYKSFLEHLSVCMHSSHDLSRGLAHDTVEVRIAALLLHLARKFSRPERNNEGAVIVDITRQQIADLTGTTPETASRVTRAMHRKGIVDMDTPGIIRVLKLEAVKKIVGEQGLDRAGGGG